MGKANLTSILLATPFGAASCFCSVTALAFMYASTNLVIELGILILIFLGWQFLAAEAVGGLVLIGISSVRIKLAYPKHWCKIAREKMEDQADDEEADFDWRRRMRGREGWNRVGHSFVSG
jgi:hypothetical protein